MKWEHVFPKKPGYYWFAGERYKKFLDGPPSHKLILCRVQGVVNGVMVTGDGQFMYESKLGD